jgi:predicted RecA/RadA family phage recombinase
VALGGNNLNLRCPLAVTHSLENTVASPGVEAGDFILVGETVGVYAEDYDTGDTGVVIYKAEKIVVPCAIATSGAYAVGAPVYYDVADNEVNESTSGNYLCGIVLVQPATGDEEIEIELDGTLNLTRGT